MRIASQSSSSNRQSAVGRRQRFAWQGWRMFIPPEWNPIRLDGDWSRGTALLADLSDAKLGLRWASVETKPDSVETARRAMIDEVGALAAEEARDYAMARPAGWRASLLYIEPDPPGRDVWVGVSAATGRLLQVVYHANRRDRVLARDLLPGLSDTPSHLPMQWAALDLSCVTPPGFRMNGRSFAAGDLRMSFVRGTERLTVRQIGPASLALTRQPIERWLAQHPLGLGRVYVSVGAPQPVSLHAMTGLKQVLVRRRRLLLHWRKPRNLVAVALHDRQRDRIVLVEAGSESLALATAETVGGAWA